MAEADVNKESDSESSLELEIGSDGTIRLFMFEPQHRTSSEEEVDSDTAQDQPETVESVVRSRSGNRDKLPRLICPRKCGCCQEMDVLGDRLDLEGRN